MKTEKYLWYFDSKHRNRISAMLLKWYKKKLHLKLMRGEQAEKKVHIIFCDIWLL